MRNKLCLLIVCLFAVSCGGADSFNENSNLNAKWASSTCFQINPDPFNKEFNSLKIIMELNNGEVTNKLHQYTDIECKVFGRELGNGLFAGLYEKYRVGNAITLESGNIANEVDFFDKNGNLFPDIYLFENTESTLYFGMKDMVLADPCPLNKVIPTNNYLSDGDVIFGDKSSCWIWTKRPSAINYNDSYTKLPE